MTQVIIIQDNGCAFKACPDYADCQEDGEVYAQCRHAMERDKAEKKVSVFLEICEELRKLCLN